MYQARSYRLTRPFIFRPYPQRHLGLSASTRRCLHERVAVLHQAVEPPIVNGVRKPVKPGGYQDSGADICYVLQQSGLEVLTPQHEPSPSQHEGWSFPDTEQGILTAVERGCTHLWANTVLFGSHPLQSSSALDKHAAALKIVGQPPSLIDSYDDKNFTNALLREDGRFRLPKAKIVDSSDPSAIADFSLPIVAKPIRGRGSHGVKVCHDEPSLRTHLEMLIGESPLVMIEEFLAGEEGTVTVMPPSAEKTYYWSLPIVVRFNHLDGIAPYNGVVAVTRNSRVPSDGELAADPTYAEICRQCAQGAEVHKVTAPIRIDVRRVKEQHGSEFAMFDINMKPNMTGPGRPGREDQASLTGMAAERLGWGYAQLLGKILESAKTLKHLRDVRL